MYQLTQHKFWGVLALIISIMFVAFMVTGCGDDDDDDDDNNNNNDDTTGGGGVEAPSATSVTATPAGGVVPSTQSFQLTFDNGVKSATVNGAAATGAGTSWTASPPLTQGENQQLTVDWVNRDDSTGTAQIGPYNVSDPDTTPPVLQAGGTVTDNQNDVDPAAVNVSGLTFTFDEDINGSIKLTDEAGADLNWAGEVTGTTAKLTVIAGQELANETTYKVEIDVTDGSNNATQLTITFVTKPKE